MPEEGVLQSGGPLWCFCHPVKMRLTEGSAEVSLHLLLLAQRSAHALLKGCSPLVEEITLEFYMLGAHPPLVY